MSDPFKQCSSRRLPPLPGNNSTHTFRRNREGSARGEDRHGEQSIGSPSMSGVNSDLVKTYLACHHEVLEDFIMEFVHTEDLETWLQRKHTNSDGVQGISRIPVSSIPSPQSRYSECEVVKIQETIALFLDDTQKDKLPLMFELVNVIGCAIRADGCSLFVPNQSRKELLLYIPGQNDGPYQLRPFCKFGHGGTIAAYVADTLTAVFLPDIIEAAMDERYPQGVGSDDVMTQSVVCVPLTLPSQDLICVMEFTRSSESSKFDQTALQGVLAMVSWVGSVLHQFQVNRTLKTQTELNEFLLGVSKIIFDDIVAMDSLVKSIMTFTKKLVMADRCAMFLVDRRKQELYSDLFDEGKEENGTPVFTKKQEIRFPINKGIAGHVARTGEIINIPDAYSDSRFNREIDVRTGYTTRNILCMPIISKGAVIGVVQMINKLQDEAFTNADEYSFKTFSVFCALALHYSKVYREVQLRTAQYKVAMEQMSYHLRCSPQEHTELMQKPVLEPAQMPLDLDSFIFYGPDAYEEQLPQLFIEMLTRLCGPNCFDLETLCRVVLTVKKNYRPVAYHNWKHAWNVAHCMFCVLVRLQENEPGLVSPLRMKALLIACLCHDIDHRGFSNAYFTSFSDPLAQLYTTSVMEQHHYAHTVTILQQDGHDLFKDLNQDEYKQVFEWIRQTIIATDLALYFGNQKTLSKLLLSGAFTIRDPEHLENALKLVVTAADISAVVKAWHVQQNTVNAIYKEFYSQGDEEKKKGLTPISMMDREKASNMPQDQVGFITHICLPCYETLADIFPSAEPLVTGCRDNLAQWQRVAAGSNSSMWMPSKSVVKAKEEEDTSGSSTKQ